MGGVDDGSGSLSLSGSLTRLMVEGDGCCGLICGVIGC